MTAPKPVIDNVGGILVVRDDLVPGGTKARVVPLLFGAGHKEYVYAGPCQGYAQVALAICARQHGYKATIFCAARKEKHPRVLEAMEAGAKVVEIGPAGYLSVVRKRAADYCRESGARLLPFGLYTPQIVGGISAIAKALASPKEVWTVAGSGTLSLALQAAWPNATFNAVLVGATPKDLGLARAWRAPERYESSARLPPPFPSCTNYDAKAWRFILRYAGSKSLFWNVAR